MLNGFKRSIQFCLCLSALLLAGSARANFTTSNFQVITTTAVSRTAVQIEVTVDVTADASMSAPNLVGTVTGPAHLKPCTTDPGMVPVGAIQASQTVTSGQFCLEWDRTVALNFADLTFIFDSVTLSVTKTLFAGPLQFGQQATYRVTITNDGTTAASGVVATDVLDSRLSFVMAGSSPACSAVMQTVTCTAMAPIPANGGTQVFDIVVLAAVAP